MDKDKEPISAEIGDAVGRGPSWADWQWQQRNSIQTVSALRAAFPGLDHVFLERMQAHLKTKRFGITPYFLSLIAVDEQTRAPRGDDPLWMQVVPPLENQDDDPVAYDAETENWEAPGEMVTPIAQRKYDNRILIRVTNICHAYCQFCYVATRTLEKRSRKAQFSSALWRDTLNYVEQDAAIEEVILSGGEPFMLSNEVLGRVLCDLRALTRKVIVRINTRTLTFNPFRIDDGLVEILRHYGVNAVGLHVTHPHEISSEFLRHAARLRAGGPLLVANIPLLKNINDSQHVIRRMGMELYRNGIIPQYLYHFTPSSPGAAVFRTSVQAGIDIVSALKRRVSNLAVPEFVLVHKTGKYTPQLGSEISAPIVVGDHGGERIRRFVNWRGQTVDYPDPPIQ